MFFLAQQPAPPLRPFVRSLWYCRAPQLDYSRQRILPSGRSQIVISLSRDFLVECTGCSSIAYSSPALLVGQRSRFEMVDTFDFADLLGVLFEPAALPAFVPDRADLCSNLSLALDDVWGGDAGHLRESLLLIETPERRIAFFEKFLLSKLRAGVAASPLVQFALARFNTAPAVASVAQVARESGWSLRRFSQLFREEVGFAPKAWCRILRLQRAIAQLGVSPNVRWADVALDCGYYDQSHLANDFHSFSGVDLSTYVKARSPLWPSHMRAD